MIVYTPKEVDIYNMAQQQQCYSCIVGPRRWSSEAHATRAAQRRAKRASIPVAPGHGDLLFVLSTYQPAERLQV